MLAHSETVRNKMNAANFDNGLVSDKLNGALSSKFDKY
jgi:hypothetical protein